MNKENLILESLNYLLWVHRPRSDRSEDIRNKLQVDIHLALNPIENNPLEQRRMACLEDSGK